mmetsp:Transcript_21369/g.39121  ORF Transcript_21369/g.39121 Transcript_21369/m.39121 type:complete len:270 (-) Transcript_21369:374-1183(-)
MIGSLAFEQELHRPIQVRHLLLAPVLEVRWQLVWMDFLRPQAECALDVALSWRTRKLQSGESLATPIRTVPVTCLCCLYCRIEDAHSSSESLRHLRYARCWCEVHAAEASHTLSLRGCLLHSIAGMELAVGSLSSLMLDLLLLRRMPAIELIESFPQSLARVEGLTICLLQVFPMTSLLASPSWWELVLNIKVALEVEELSRAHPLVHLITERVHQDIVLCGFGLLDLSLGHLLASCRNLLPLANPLNNPAAALAHAAALHVFKLALRT